MRERAVGGLTASSPQTLLAILLETRLSSADNTLTLTRPDDWHLHLRDGEALAAVVGASARQFARAIVMPNLKPPVTTLDEALAYRARIVAALPEGADFTPLMTLYLTDRTHPDEIRRAAQSGVVHAVKLYPAGATTHSDAGVTDLAHTHAALEAMQACGMPLLVHGEVTDPEVDVFDREAVFIDTVLEPLRRRFPDLRVVLEHITRLTDDICPEWPQPAQPGGNYRIEITGEPCYGMDICLSSPNGDHNHAGVLATAMRIVNAIPAVIAAAPGIRTTLDLPLVTGKGLYSAR